MREIPDIPESVDELEGVGEGVALLVPDDVCICCETGKKKKNLRYPAKLYMLYVHVQVRTHACTCRCTYIHVQCI